MIIRIVLSLAVSLVLFATASTVRAASIVTDWFDEAIPIANDVAWEPTVGTRFFAILSSAIYDAWTAYDPKAVAVVSGAALKNRGGPANEASKREAISHAAYTVLCALAPHHRRALSERMAALGYDPNATTPPAELGRLAANAVLAKFRDDGANESGGFADTTGYKTKTDAPGHWQPILAFGQPQLPTTPQWGRVMPFALGRAEQYRPPPPPVAGTEAWFRQIHTLIDTSGALTDDQKAAVEYWNEWGSSPTPHLIELTKFVSGVRDFHLDDDARLFFAVSSALLDVSIATWDAKYVYDYVRPITAVHSLGNIPIKAWRPRSMPAVLAYSSPSTAASLDSPVVQAGTADLPAAEWEPYLPTPSFPSYVSGHSAFCAAWARVMTLATGTPELNLRKIVKHLYVEQRELAVPVALDYPTYQAAAEACGQSCIWGGIHWPVDNEHGRELGRKVGENAWDRAQQFLLGTASPATATLAALHSPFWFHQDEASSERANYPDGTGLAADLSSGAVAAWRSIVLDPVPAGHYELRLKLATSGEAAVRLNVAIESSGSPETAPLAASEFFVDPAGKEQIVTLPWTSDGARSFVVSIKSGPDVASAHILVSAMDIVRVWPVVSGSPRFVEPSLAGRPQQSCCQARPASGSKKSGPRWNG
jgi:hypothetical protein